MKFNLIKDSPQEKVMSLSLEVCKENWNSHSAEFCVYTWGHGENTGIC